MAEPNPKLVQKTDMGAGKATEPRGDAAPGATPQETAHHRQSNGWQGELQKNNVSACRSLAHTTSRVGSVTVASSQLLRKLSTADRPMTTAL